MGSRAEFRILAGSAAFPVCEAQTHAADRALCEDLGKQGLGLGTCLYCIWMLTDKDIMCCSGKTDTPLEKAPSLVGILWEE